MLTAYGTSEDIAAAIAEAWELERSRTPPQRPPIAPGVLDEIDPPDYVQALTGVEVPHHGTINCPLPGHDDRTPSFHAYPDPGRGWYCFGCCRGGTIYDLGAELWGIGTRGSYFHELRRRLARELRA